MSCVGILFRALVVFLALVLPALSGGQQTSSTLASDMISDARYDYNDSVTNHFTAAEMLRFLNDGMMEIAAMTHCMEHIENINLAPNTMEYSIYVTADYIKVFSVVYINSSSESYSLKRGNINLIGLDIEESDIDAPVFWYEFNGKVGIYPTVSTSDTYINVYYSERPYEIGASEDILTTAIYDNSLKYYILMRMAQKDRNLELYRSLSIKYNRELSMYRSDLQEK